eukprot:TRINITY_DN3144_c0_g1_i2.p1 TRINITY_DN3144_c0_g1~~TRINITY_DN3144_c0_g1_i2.p1  ORF type:complete len:232 (-),score=78.95 TRINITY_DN3144_c0_g1_i2:563-1258(-)
MGLFQQIQHNVEVMSLTIPEDKKKIIVKEVAALQEKLVVVEQYKEKVDIIDKFCNDLKAFDGNLKTVDAWMMGATKELEEIKNASDKMAPEDRVARTMDLQEDIAAKVVIIKANIETELALLPQGEKVPQDAQEHKDELNRITKYVTDLQNKLKRSVTTSPRMSSIGLSTKLELRSSLLGLCLQNQASPRVLLSQPALGKHKHFPRRFMDLRNLVLTILKFLMLQMKLLSG